MKPMNHRHFAPLALVASAGVLAVVAACSSSPNTVRTKTESTTTTSHGKVNTTTDTREVGSTVDARSSTTAESRSGTRRSATATIVGTVTLFASGKSIEVMTGEKKMHSFSLDDRSIAYSVDREVSVGDRVTVTDETGDDKVRRITVTMGG
jgi:hypothetical protein